MFHTKSAQETLQHLECSSEGLSADEALKRTQRYGKNVLQQAKKRGVVAIFAQQFKGPIVYILFIAATVSFLIGEYSDAGFILAALLLNAVVGTYQEYVAGEKADALKKAIKTFVYVLRDGRRVEIPSEDVTVGDVVFFESGVKVPSDIDRKSVV